MSRRCAGPASLVQEKTPGDARPAKARGEGRTARAGGNLVQMAHCRLIKPRVLIDRVCAISGGLLHVRQAGLSAWARSTQDGPVDVGAKLLAAHGTLDGALDVRAAFGRNLSDAANPLMHHGRRHAQRARQNGLTAEDLACNEYWVLIHAKKYSPAIVFMQALLDKLFGSVAI